MESDRHTVQIHHSEVCAAGNNGLAHDETEATCSACQEDEFASERESRRNHGRRWDHSLTRCRVRTAASIDDHLPSSPCGAGRKANYELFSGTRAACCAGNSYSCNRAQAGTDGEHAGEEVNQSCNKRLTTKDQGPQQKTDSREEERRRGKRRRRMRAECGRAPNAPSPTFTFVWEGTPILGKDGAAREAQRCCQAATRRSSFLLRSTEGRSKAARAGQPQTHLNGGRNDLPWALWFSFVSVALLARIWFAIPFHYTPSSAVSSPIVTQSRQYGVCGADETLGALCTRV